MVFEINTEAHNMSQNNVLYTKLYKISYGTDMVFEINTEAHSMRQNRYSKTVNGFHKEGNELCIIYPLIYGSVLSVRAYYFISPRNQTTSGQNKFSQNWCIAL